MLTPKQQRFVEEYLVDLNASAAYQRAGYTARGNAAEADASRLLRNAKVAAAIAAAKAQRSKRTELTADWVVDRLRTEALREDEDSSHGARVQALKTLAQHLGMLVQKVEHSGSVGRYADMNDAEIEQRIRELEQREARPARGAKPAPG